MEDIFNTKIICNQCNHETEDSLIIKEGFKLRAKKCPHCSKTWYHPADMEEQKRFQRLRNKTYQVKLRMVGNSYTISIPKEIIDFHEEFQKDINTLLSLTLEEPEKLSIFFTRRLFD